MRCDSTHVLPVVETIAEMGANNWCNKRAVSNTTDEATAGLELDVRSSSTNNTFAAAPGVFFGVCCCCCCPPFFGVLFDAPLAADRCFDAAFCNPDMLSALYRVVATLDAVSAPSAAPNFSSERTTDFDRAAMSGVVAAATLPLAERIDDSDSAW